MSTLAQQPALSLPLAQRVRLRPVYVWLFGLGLYLPIFANYTGGKAFQVAYLFLWTVAAFGMLFGSAVSMTRPTPIEMLNLVIGLTSTLVVMVSGDAFGALFSAVFMVTIVQVYVLTRLVTLKDLLDIGAYVMLAALVTCALANVSDLMMALSAVVGRRGLFRFQPLQNHPNLTGFIFGGAAVLFVRKLIAARGVLRSALWAGCAGLAAIFVFAASARAALLALVVASLAASWLFRRELRRALPLIVTVFMLAVVAVLAVGSDRVVRYLDRILEFSSNTRGIGSGGTGRFDLWARGLHALTSDFPRMMFGDGLRSSEFSGLGFNIESSYIAIMLDSGMLLGLVFMLMVLYLIFVRPRGLGPEDEFTSRCFKVLLVYVASQSVFNRYFLALGNPLSLFVLCAMNAAFLFYRERRHAFMSRKDLP